MPFEDIQYLVTEAVRKVKSAAAKGVEKGPNAVPRGVRNAWRRVAKAYSLFERALYVVLLPHYALAGYVLRPSLRKYGKASASKAGQSGNTDRPWLSTLLRGLGSTARFLRRFALIDLPALFRSTQSSVRLLAEALSLAALAQFLQQDEAQDGIIHATWGLLVRFWLNIACQLMHDGEGACRMDIQVGQIMAAVLLVILAFTLVSSGRMALYLSKRRRFGRREFVRIELKKILPQGFQMLLPCAFIGSICLIYSFWAPADAMHRYAGDDDQSWNGADWTIYWIIAFWAAGFPWLAFALTWQGFEFLCLRRKPYHFLLGISYLAPPVFLMANFALPFLYIQGAGRVAEMILRPVNEVAALISTEFYTDAALLGKLAATYVLLAPVAMHYAFMLASLAGNSAVLARAVVLFGFVMAIDMAADNWMTCSFGDDGVATCTPR